MDRKTGVMDLENPALRMIEDGMLQRKADFNKRSGGARAGMLKRVAGKTGTKMDWSDVIRGDSYAAQVKRFVASWTMPLVSRLFTWWYNWELQQGIAGSDPTTPLYPVVVQALEKEDARRSTA